MSSCSADSKDPGRTSTVSLGSSYQPREMSSPPASPLRVFKTTNCQTGGSHAGSMCPPRERRKGITGGRQLPPCTSDVAASKLSETFLGHSRAPVTTAADIRTYMLYFPVSCTHPAPWQHLLGQDARLSAAGRVSLRFRASRRPWKDSGSHTPHHAHPETQAQSRHAVPRRAVSRGDMRG